MTDILTTLQQLQRTGNAILQKVKDKNYAVSASTLSGYGITDAYTKTEIDGLIGATYRPAGTIEGSALVSTLLVAGNVGKVYNINSDLSITAENEDLFLNLSAGDKVKAGDDVGVVEVEVEEGGETTTAYLFNDFAAFIDLSGVTYTGGDGIEIDANNKVNIDIDSTDGNGLGFTAGGKLKLDPVAASTSGAGGSNGAMTPQQAEKLSGLENTTAGDGIEINNHAATVKIDSANARGLNKTSAGLGLAEATADTWGGVAATGTYVAGTKYYTTAACTTEVDTSDFVVGETDVSSYFVYQKTEDGTAGAFTSAEKTKLANMSIATDAAVNTMIAGLMSL